MFDLQGFGDQLLEGATVTIELALASLVVGLILGTLTAVARLSDNRIAQKVATLYSTVIRGIPELLTVLIIYFGTATLLMAIARQFGYDEYIEIGPFTAGVIALGLTPTLVWLALLVLLGIVVQIGLTRRAGYKIRRRPTRRMLFN